MNRVAHAVARPFLAGAIDSALGFSHLPMPVDDPHVHAPGPDPDRLLMVGTAAVAGVGVASFELGLGGQLARRIATSTGRGVDVDLAGSLTLTVPEAQQLIADKPLDLFDAVVLYLGSREAITFQPMRMWKKQLRELLQSVGTSPDSPHVFVVSAPPIYRYANLPTQLVDRMAEHLRRQGEVTASVCAELPNATFLAFTPPPAGDFYQLGSAAYDQWAELIAPAIIARLDCDRLRRRPIAPIDEQARQAALDELAVIDSHDDELIDRIARTARDLLGASGASVTLLDHERQWIRSAVAMSKADTARADSFCNVTISRPEIFVVEDVAENERFAEHPWVVGEEHVRFYAGYPVEAPNGQRIGALCIVDTKPRHFSGAEAALLRDLALRVQSLLWHTAGRTA